MAECSPEEYLRSSTDPSHITCLSRGDSIGLTVTVEAGLLSLLAILYIFLLIARNVRRRMRHLSEGLQVFHQSMDLLMTSLFVADVLQAIGAVMGLKWIRDGMVVTGHFCQAQGIIKMVGASAVAFSTMAIAVYTFLEIWVRKDISMRCTVGVIATFWSFILLLVVVPVIIHRDETFSFIAPAPYWCWANKQYVGIGWQLAFEYLWIFLTLGLSLLIYVPLYLWTRGNLIMDEEVWWRASFEFTNPVNPESRRRRSKSLVMLAYPAVYCLIAIPMCAVRWKTYVQQKYISPVATFAVSSVFALSGFLNVILVLKTRPRSSLFGQLMFLRPPTLVLPSRYDQLETVEMDSGRPPPSR